MKEVLVTGVAGFIGQKVAEKLLDSGRRVVGIDNMNDYYDVKLKEFRLSKLIERKGFAFFAADIENLEEVRGIFEKHCFDSVFNLAARAGVRYSMENPWVYLRTNTEGTLNLLECMKDFQVEKLVLASTSSLYAGLSAPFSEDYPVNTPISPYAASKKAAEAFAYTYHKQYGIDVSVLRYFTVFGPLGRPDMAPYRIVKWIIDHNEIIIYGDGMQTRDFTYIDDIADGTLLAEKKLGFEIINLGGGNQPVSILSFIQKAEEFIGTKAIIKFHPFHSADMSYTHANIEKANKILGWKPKWTVNDGIQEMINHREYFVFNI